jgi:hypothetical protein
VQATIGDGPGSIYVESLEGAIQKFVPVYIDTSEIADPATAGSDETPPVLPVNTPINAVSNESWLTITGESGGAITFSFAATTVARSAVISVLGQDVITQNIVVSQAAPAAIGASAGGARVRERAGRPVLRSKNGTGERANPDFSSTFDRLSPTNAWWSVDRTTGNSEGYSV